jgi:hypothetical protein
MSSRFHPDFDPLKIAPDIAEMRWPELDQLANDILARMSLVAEAAGAPVQGRVSSGKPEGSAPHGDQALADEYADKIAVAAATDLAADPYGSVTTKFGWAVLAAATALHRVTKRGPASDDPDPDQAGVERHDAILVIYEGIDPHHAAALETARAGYVSAAAIRSCRRENARHGETGLPVPIGPELRAEVRRHNAAGHSLREIARRVDIGKTTVVRILTQPDEGQEAIAA